MGLLIVVVAFTAFAMKGDVDPKTVWSVADGVIKCLGKPNGYLRTEQAYHDYKVTVEWRFTKAGEEWFCFAGLWRPARDGVPEAFTLLTTAPGPDVAPIHNRQMVVLDRADWMAWLDLTRPEADLLRALPAGSLNVEQVRGESLLI